MKRCILFTMIMFAFHCLVWAQSSERQLYFVHEDHVYPSMVSQYEELSKELVDLCKEHDFDGLPWITFAADDFRYISSSPISKMADLDGNYFKSLESKVGKEKLDMLFDKMNECYSTHGSYTMTLRHDLSYMPTEGAMQPPEGFRSFLFYHVDAGDFDEFIEMGKKMKELFKSKGSKLHYQILTSGFGAMGTYVVVSGAAASASEYFAMVEENYKVLGKEGMEAFSKLNKMIIKQDRVTAVVKPELSFIPEN